MGSPITFSGFNQIDFSVVLNAIMQQESQPLQALQTQQQTLQKTDTALSQLAAKLDTLRAAASSLSSASSLTDYSVTTSENTVAVSAGAGATAGRYDVVVDELARAQSIASTSTAHDTDTTIVAAGGSITIGGVTVALGGPATLGDIASKINSAADVPVVAQIVETTPGEFRLVVTGKQTGAVHDFTIQNNLTGSTLAFADSNGDGLSGNSAADNLQQATDASLRINNLQVTSASNTVTSGIPGVTLTLLQKDPSKTAVVNVGRDDTSLANKVDTFVGAYNDLVKFADEQGQASKNGTGTFGRDSLLRTLRSTLRGVLSSTHGTGAYTALAEVGIGFNRTGQVTFDKASFSAALQKNPDAVKKLFTDPTSGVFNDVSTTIADYTRSGGLVPGARTRLNDELSRLGRRIDDMQVRLSFRRSSLQKEFIAADEAMTRLNGQSGSLSSMASSLSANSL